VDGQNEHNTSNIQYGSTMYTPLDIKTPQYKEHTIKTLQYKEHTIKIPEY